MPLRQWVISFPFPLRYLFAAHPQAIGKVLGSVYRAISNHLSPKAGLQLSGGATGAVTLIQRFGSALNLYIHFQILFLDGVYVYRDHRSPRFQRVSAPYRDGTTQVALDRGDHPSVDFIARLAALLPKPRVNLTRYHGVLACAAQP